jgi:diguanylate cyclase (GGDEF)-like protein
MALALPNPPPRAAQALAALRAFAASVDGTLIGDENWLRRHQRLVGVCLAQVGLAAGVATFATRDALEWVAVVVMLACASAACVSRLGRRPRQLAVAGAFVVSQVFASRYVGNLSGLNGVYIILLSFYQDWVPIAVAVTVCAVMVGVVAIDPSVMQHNVGFAQESPLAGISFRFLAVTAAAGVAIAVWRSGTQLARDHLTGLLSRAGAERLLDRRIARGHRPTVWVCDVDNFRAINDSIGSAAGDLVLREVGARVRRSAASLLDGSICARLGADAFLVATQADPGDAAILAYATEVAPGALSHTVMSGGIGIPVRLSVGVAGGSAGERASDVIRCAERAMRHAKGQGSSRVLIDRGDRRGAARPASLLTAELYRACDNGELELYYQPVVCLATGRPIAAESLVRWNHPDRGLLYPGTFLAEAEADSALMAHLSTTLGLQFRDHVMDWTERHGPDWLQQGFSYNLAAVRLQDPTLMESMAWLLAASGRSHPEWRVTLEVTEGALMDVEQEVPALLKQLSDHGYLIALDDFGTGHSSLAHLRDFPIDVIKLDRSFVSRVDRSLTDRAIIQAVIDIAAASGLAVVAEGVETELQREVLLAMKSDIRAQGWLYAAALPAPEFEAWVQERLGPTDRRSGR